MVVDTCAFCITNAIRLGEEGKIVASSDVQRDDRHLEFLEVRRYQATISVPESVISPSSGCPLTLPPPPPLSPSRFSFARGAPFTGYSLDGNFPPVALITAIFVRLTIIIS